MTLWPLALSLSYAPGARSNSMVLRPATAATGFAADVPGGYDSYPSAYTAPSSAYAAPPAAWSGLYLGAMFGYNWGTFDPDGGFDVEADGLSVGGFAGYNAQSGALVFGGEADLAMSSMDGSRGSADADMDWSGSLRGRLGYTFDRHLLYDLLTERISVDHDLAGANMCACLFDQSHWEKAYERGQPGFWTIDGEPRPHLIRTVQRSNKSALQNVLNTHDQETIQALDEKFHHVLGLYREVMKHRNEFLEKVPVITDP